MVGEFIGTIIVASNHKEYNDQYNQYNDRSKDKCLKLASDSSVTGAYE